jgi:N-acetyl-anhydromuramyl-L-alanine amidase AmpD
LFFKNIHSVGYRYFSKNKSSKSDKKIIKAFQRRFLPSKVSGKIDQKTLDISHFLAKKFKN